MKTLHWILVMFTVVGLGAQAALAASPTVSVGASYRAGFVNSIDVRVGKVTISGRDYRLAPDFRVYLPNGEAANPDILAHEKNVRFIGPTDSGGQLTQVTEIRIILVE